MTYYTDYLEEISARKEQGLHAKPIDNHSLMEEIIQQIKDENNVYRKDSLNYFIYNTLQMTFREPNTVLHQLQPLPRGGSTTPWLRYGTPPQWTGCSSA